MRVGIMDARGFLFQNPLPLLSQYARLARRELFHPVSPKPRPNPTRMISVIIPAHNEEAYLQRTLDALRRQNYGWFETVVVANGCTDRTVEVARGKCHRLIVLSQKSL